MNAPIIASLWLSLTAFTAHAENTTVFIGRYVNGSISNYEPASDCKETECTICLRFGGYYLYTFQALSKNSPPALLTTTMLSHSPKFGDSVNPWLISVEKLSQEDAALIGAEYEIVDFALLNEAQCSESSLISSPWLFTPPYTPAESSNSSGKFCYRGGIEAPKVI
ncbi:hypothetical protein HPT27_18840 [Permianibacter sp. IMCC34836]|uniref:hypothetical protein n=1 Tax=Permianibacter fluminis TaxID=2738515 RepID=UPI001555C7AC|nr:hypothetical protein [Permianibacter fluminis]NQD39079.1 hypothetical protein [Permianibacter fluminis]